jgi:drug/metabolite transporter (DMT)-like permease
VPVVLGLLSATLWGAADFIGGLASRRAPVLRVLLLTQALGAVLLGAALLIARPDFPHRDEVLAAMAAGLAGEVALGCFYRGLAIGTMSIIAPISATGAALPVIVGLASGDALSAAAAAGIGLAVVGVVLASRETGEPIAGGPSAGSHRAAIGLALLAAVGFGAYFVLMDSAAEGGVLWALSLARGMATATMVGAVLVVRTRVRPEPGELRLLAAVAVLDVAGQAAYALGSTKGLLSVVAVLSALYPVTTVLLARVVLKERVARAQEAGIVIALLGVGLIAAG